MASWKKKRACRLQLGMMHSHAYIMQEKLVSGVAQCLNCGLPISRAFFFLSVKIVGWDNLREQSMKSDLCQIALSWLILPGKLMIDQMDCLPFPRQAAGLDGPITPKEYVVWGCFWAAGLVEVEHSPLWLTAPGTRLLGSLTKMALVVDRLSVSLQIWSHKFSPSHSHCPKVAVPQPFCRGRVRCVFICLLSVKDLKYLESRIQ